MIGIEIIYLFVGEHQQAEQFHSPKQRTNDRRMDV